MPGADITLNLESRYPERTLVDLRAMGHVVQGVGPYAIGSIQAIRATGWGGKVAGADPRRMAAAAGY